MAQVPVYFQPLVAIFSTGDELRRVEEELGPGEIRDTNSYALAAAAAENGARVLRLEVAGDRQAEVQARFAEALQAGAQLIISSAGVSVGAYDVVKAAVEAEGALELLAGAHAAGQAAGIWAGARCAVLRPARQPGIGFGGV